MQTSLMHSVCKYFENKKIFSNRLKITRVKLLSLRQLGSEFHAYCPVYEKAILPYVDSFGRGTSSCPLAAERRRLRPSITETGRHISIIYFGAMTCRHLQMWTQSLNWVHSQTSSRCSSPCLCYHDEYPIRPAPRIFNEINISGLGCSAVGGTVIRQETVSQSLVLIWCGQFVVFIFYYITLNTND